MKIVLTRKNSVLVQGVQRLRNEPFDCEEKLASELIAAGNFSEYKEDKKEKKGKK